MFIKGFGGIICMVDIREFSVSALAGNCIGFFAPMNGGKTQALVDELKRAWYYDCNSIAYNSERNTRERDAIVVNGEFRHPAKTVGSVPELRTDLEKRISQLGASQEGQRGEVVIIDDISHHRGWPLRVVGIDEVNLFSLTASEAREMMDLMNWCIKKDIVLYVAGLIYDFRHLPFGQVHSLLPYVDIKIDKKPACMVIDSSGQKCVRTAKHTQRLWKMSYSQERGLNDVELPRVDFVDKDKKPVVDHYVAAPFFDQTVLIESGQNAGRGRNVVYLPVCTECARLPYREETFRVYDAIVRGGNPEAVLSNPQLTAGILEFLCSPDERWGKRESDGRIVALSHYRNEVGGFSSL